MDDLNDLKAIWRSAKTDDLPDTETIKQMSRNFRNRKLRKKIVLIITALLLALLMIAVMFFYHSSMITTRIGELMMLSAACLLVYTNVNSIGRFYRYRDYSNKEFLQFLEQTRLNQLRYYRKTQVAGLALCSAGLLLYELELALHQAFAGVITYVLVIAFILIMWLIVRPRVFRRQIQKTNRLIQQLKSLSDQL